MIQLFWLSSNLLTVSRFASFVEGSSHLSDEEMLDYETSMAGDLTDDENDHSFTEEDEDDEWKTDFMGKNVLLYFHTL